MGGPLGRGWLQRATLVRVGVDRHRLLPVHVQLSTHDAGDPPRIPEPGWTDTGQTNLALPTGTARLGDATLTARSVELPRGPGIYRLRVSHFGRGEAAQAAAALRQRESTQPGSLTAEQCHVTEPIERYRIQLWYDRPLPDDYDEDG